MRRSIWLSGVWVSLLLLSTHADTTITNAELDYTAYLPDNWIVERFDSTQHHFFDTTGTYPALLSIVRYRRNPADYPTPQEWTRAHFIAYKMTAEYSAEPWGAVLFYDTSSSCKQQSLWATEAYAVYFCVDTTLGSWAEYIRYTASDSYGYELYALSDTTDMAANVGVYAAILQGIELPEKTSSAARSRFRLTAGRPAMTRPNRYVFDPRGRRLIATGIPSSPSLYLTPEHKLVLGLPR